MKRNNAEFTNVISFTSRRMCSAHFRLTFRILILALPTSNSFVQFVFAEIPRESAWWGPVKASLVLAASPVVAIYQNWNRLDSGSEISTTLQPYAGSSCTSYFVFCIQKIH